MTDTQREAFEAACNALPEGVNWGDRLTPEIVRHIMQAAQAAQAEQQGDFDPELMRDAAMRTVQAMGLVYTPGADRWKPNRSAEQQGDGGALTQAERDSFEWLDRLCTPSMYLSRLGPIRDWVKHNAIEQPSARVALSDEQIIDVAHKAGPPFPWGIGSTRAIFIQAARAILAAHEAQTGESKC